MTKVTWAVQVLLLAGAVTVANGQVARFETQATREGLAGQCCTANTRKIAADGDWFVALPSREHLARNNSWDIPVDANSIGPVRVRVTLGGRSVIAPIWDVGPQNTRDDYWNEARNADFVDPSSLLNNFPPQGKSELEWARVLQWHYGYTVSKPADGIIRALNPGPPFDPGTQKPAPNQAGIDLSNRVYQQGLGLLQGDTNPKVAWQFTEDLPSIRQVVIRQDGKLIFDLRNGVSIPVTDCREPLQTTIGFTETMRDVDYPITSIGLSAPFGQVPLKGYWSQGVYEKDTWNGTLGLSGIGNGAYTLSVIAADWGSKAGQPGVGPHGGNQIDSDHDASNGYQPGPDTTVRLNLACPPFLALISGGKESAYLVSGTENIVDQSQSGAGIFSASDADGFKSVAVASPPGGLLEILEPAGLDPAAIPAGTSFIRGRFTGLALGPHTLSVFNRHDQETRARWSVEALSVDISSKSTSVFDPATGRFAGRLGLDFSGTRDLLRLEMVKAPLEDPLNLALTGSLPLAGRSDLKTFDLNSAPDFADPLGTVVLVPPGGLPDSRAVFEGPWRFFLRDKDGGVLDAALTAAQGSWAGTLPSKIYPWTPATSTGTQESPLYDLFDGDAKALPGAVIPVGNVRDLITGLTFRHDPVSVNMREAGLLSGLPIGRQVIGRVTLTLRTGPEPESLGPARTLIDAEIDAELRAVLVPTILPNDYVPVQRYFKLGLSFTPTASAAINSSNCLSTTQNGEICASGKNFEPELTSAGEPLVGQIVIATGTPTGVVPVAAGPDQILPLGLGLVASAVNVGNSGFFLPSQTAGSAKRGFRGLPRDASLFLRPHPLAALITAPFQASVTYDALGLTPGQKELARVVKVSTSGIRTRLAASVDPGGDKLTFTIEAPARVLDLSQFPERLELEAPDYPDPEVVAVGDMELVSNRAGITATETTAPQSAVAALRSQGLHLVSRVYDACSPATTLNPPGIIKLLYNPQASATLGFPLDNLLVASFHPDGSFEVLDAPITNEPNADLSAISAEEPRFRRGRRRRGQEANGHIPDAALEGGVAANRLTPAARA